MPELDQQFSSGRAHFAPRAKLLLPSCNLKCLTMLPCGFAWFCTRHAVEDLAAGQSGGAIDEGQERPEPQPEAGTEEREPPNNFNFKFNSCKTPIPPHPIPQRPETFATEHTCGDAASCDRGSSCFLGETYNHDPLLSIR
jgi:hypothetical protein